MTSITKKDKGSGYMRTPTGSPQVYIPSYYGEIVSSLLGLNPGRLDHNGTVG